MNTSNSPDKRITAYVIYCHKRFLGGLPVDEVASALGYEAPEALYRKLAVDGFPVCEVCGATPAGTGHCEQPAAKKRKAKSASDGTVLKLPPAGEALPLFEEVLGTPMDPVAGGLHGRLRGLRDLEEELHGKRFVSNMVHRPEDPVGFEGTLRREDFSEDEWQGICEGLSQDHRHTDKITPYDVPGGPGMLPLGTRRIPAEDLLVLIATYALTRKNLYPLIEKLHPEPEAVDREQLESVRANLRLAAEHMATVVRGGTVGKGAPTEGLTQAETISAYLIADLKEQGLSYDQIHSHLEEYGRDLSRREVERLGGFRLPRPDY